MTSLTLTAVLYASILAGTETYVEAHRTATETGKPIVVMVSTDWCLPCQEMKKTVLPQVRKDGLLSEVSFAIVNADHDQDLAQQLTGGGPVPQLVMFRQTDQGWKRRKLVGGQTVEAVKQFLRDGLALDRSDNRNQVKHQPVSKVSASANEQ